MGEIFVEAGPLLESQQNLGDSSCKQEFSYVQLMVSWRRSLVLRKEHQLAKQLCSQKTAWENIWQHMANLGKSKKFGIGGT